MLNGDKKTYYSIDHATHNGVDQSDENIHLLFPIGTLNNIYEGLPPHKLDLKINAIVILIRNLSIHEGLCNGTRLKITKLTGEFSSLPFILYRKQFPVTLAFCMTINKSEGQSFDCVGLYIKRQLFSHGQLYVALSRCKNPKNIYTK